MLYHLLSMNMKLNKLCIFNQNEFLQTHHNLIIDVRSINLCIKRKTCLAIGSEMKPFNNMLNDHIFRIKKINCVNYNESNIFMGVI